MTTQSYVHSPLTTISKYIVGLYSPIGSTHEREASVLRSIHSSGALLGPTTLGTEEVSYSRVPGFGIICGPVRSLDQGA